MSEQPDNRIDRQIPADCSKRYADEWPSDYPKMNYAVHEKLTDF